MQSFLGDYSRSRKTPNEKFIRAVNSFLSQNSNNCELIIIADSCRETKKIYNENFKNYDSIKCVYLEQETPLMYYSNNDKIYYRGYPRQIGVDLSNGDIITYIDSDDYLLPNASQILEYYWNRLNENIIFCLNNTWYDNYVADYKNYSILDKINWFYIKEKNVTIPNLDSYWNLISGIDETISIFTPWSLSHRKDICVKWEDVFSNKISEDNHFIQKLLNYYPYKRYTISEGYYVRCNYYDNENDRFLWDI